MSLPNELADSLKREAKRRGVPVSRIIREAIEARLGAGGVHRDLPFIGLGRSGYHTTAEDIDKILEAEWGELDRDR